MKDKLLSINKYPKNPLPIIDYVMCVMKDPKRVKNGNTVRMCPSSSFMKELYEEWKWDGVDFYFMDYSVTDDKPYDMKFDKELTFLSDVDITQFFEIVVFEYEDSEITDLLIERLFGDAPLPTYLKKKIQFLNVLFDGIDEVLYYGDVKRDIRADYLNIRFEKRSSFSYLVYHYVLIHNELMDEKINLIELE